MTDHPTPNSDFSNLDVSFGEYLKQERFKKGISIEIISRKTGIKIANLIALENGARRKLPADAFVRGFIRSYADVLKINSQKALDSYDKEWGFSNGMKGSSIFLGKNSMAEPSSIFTDKHFLTYILIVVLAAASFFSYNFFSPSNGIFYLLQKFTLPITFNKKPDQNTFQFPLNDEISKNNNNTTVPNHVTKELIISSSPDELSEKNLTDTQLDISSAKSEQENIDPENLYEPEKAPITEKEAATGQYIIQEPLFLFDHPEPFRITFGQDEEVHPDSGPKKITEPLLPAGKNIAVTAISNTLRASFVEKTWMRITIDQNEPVEYTFQPNEKYSWNATSKIKLFVGNAGGVQLSLNGVPIKILKKSGETLKMTLP